jgi:hypothetical protein
MRAGPGRKEFIGIPAQPNRLRAVSNGGLHFRSSLITSKSDMRISAICRQAENSPGKRRLPLNPELSHVDLHPPEPIDDEN